MPFDPQKSLTNTVTARISAITGRTPQRVIPIAKSVIDYYKDTLPPKESLVTFIGRQLFPLEQDQPLSPEQTAAVISETTRLVSTYAMKPDPITLTLTEQFTLAAPQNPVSATQSITQAFIQSGAPTLTHALVTQVPHPSPSASTTARIHFKEELTSGLTREGLQVVAQSHPNPSAVQQVIASSDLINPQNLLDAYQQTYSPQTATDFRSFTNPDNSLNSAARFLVENPVTDWAKDKAVSYAKDWFFHTNLGQSVIETASRFGLHLGGEAAAVATEAAAGVTATGAVTTAAGTGAAVAAGAVTTTATGVVAGTGAATAAGTGAAVAASTATGVATAAAGTAAGATAGVAGGAAAGAAAGSVAPGIGTAIGAVVGAVAGVVVGMWSSIKKWIKEYIVPLIAGLVGLGVAFVSGSLALGLGAGLAALGLTSFFTGGSAALAGIGATISGILVGLTTAAVAAIATPVIIAIVATPIVIAFFLFIINSGAYVVPTSSLTFIPGPGSGGFQNRSGCPLINGRITTLSYDPNLQEEARHGSNRYWRGQGICTGRPECKDPAITSPNACRSTPGCIWTGCRYHMPADNRSCGPTQGSTNYCINPANFNCSSGSNAVSNPFYGWAIDVVSDQDNSTVSLPLVNGQVIDWTYEGNPYNTSAGYAHNFRSVDGQYFLHLMHMNQAVVVTVGQSYPSGTRVGTLFVQRYSCPAQPSGFCDNTHLHIEFYVNGVIQKPENYFCG